MTIEDLEAIREYYPDADVKPVRLRGRQVGYGVCLAPDEAAIGLSDSETMATKRARDYLVMRGDLPDVK